jgi:hypothetical protein
MLLVSNARREAYRADVGLKSLSGYAASSRPHWFCWRKFFWSRMPAKLLTFGAAALVSGCGPSVSAPTDKSREAFLACLANYIAASRVTNAVPTFAEALTDAFCAKEERDYRVRIMLAAFRVSPTGQRETADLVIRHAWEEMVR